MGSPLDGLGRMRAAINVTPLVDVLLVLLIIFIMVTPILTKAVPSNIPQKTSQPFPSEVADRQLVIHVRADGRVILNHEDVDAERLPARLREVFAQRGGRRIVFIDAADEVPYGAVVAVMDLCRDGGVRTLGVVPDSIGTHP